MNKFTEELFSYFIYSGASGTPPPRDLDIIKSLIEQGAELDKTDSVLGKDFLTHAITNTKNKKERFATVQLLIEAGAKINFKKKQGPTPLSSALNVLDFQIVKLLLENGAIIVPTRDLASARVIEKDDIRLFELLLDHHLDVNAPISESSMGGADDDILCKGGSILNFAVRVGAHKIMRRLIRNKVDIHYCPSPFEGSALFTAVNLNNIEATVLLLQAGANPNEKVGHIPILRTAIGRLHIECVKLLLIYGAKSEGAYFEEDIVNQLGPKEDIDEMKALFS